MSVRGRCTLRGLLRATLFGIALALSACADDGAHFGGDAGVDAGPRECAGFLVPARSDTSACADLAPDGDPAALVACSYGSGNAGVWAIDGAGLPAYDFAIDERCDPVGRASGAVELYSQDRGHTWFNRLDTWRDPTSPAFPPQLGGGFSYLALPDGTVGSTRFEDLPLGEATALQTRRFGVGYVETVTTLGALRVTRRVLAPDAEARALVVLRSSLVHPRVRVMGRASPARRAIPPVSAPLAADRANRAVRARCAAMLRRPVTPRAPARAVAPWVRRAAAVRVVSAARAWRAATRARCVA